MLTVGSMFSGLLGGLDIACERVFDAETVWQLDITGADVRRRHWPGVVQVEADVRTVDPADLARVDVLCGGFPCQDLSTAGKGAGLDGERSGLYREVIRFAQVLRPQFVVFENVAPLLNVLDVLGADLRSVGYGLTYAVCEAADAGLPHLRRRVFVVAEAGTAGRGRVEVDGSRRWNPVHAEQGWPTPTAVGGQGDSCEVYEARKARHKQWPGESLATSAVIAQGDERAWATILASEAEGRRTSLARRADPDLLSEQVREWATPSANESGTGKRGPGAGRGSCPGDESLTGQVREWPTATASDVKASRAEGYSTESGRHSGTTLTDAVQPWATVTTRDHKSGDLPNRVGTEALSAQAGAQALGQYGRRLNPAWVETLMGVPQGWTLPTGPSLRDQLDAWRAPRGRYPAGWDRSVPWPGFAWEPSRTLPDGPPCPGRPARIRGLGNGVVWQQAEIGIGACLGESVSGQLDLFAAVAR